MVQLHEVKYRARSIILYNLLAHQHSFIREVTHTNIVRSCVYYPSNWRQEEDRDGPYLICFLFILCCLFYLLFPLICLIHTASLCFVANMSDPF